MVSKIWEKSMLTYRVLTSLPSWASTRPLPPLGKPQIFTNIIYRLAFLWHSGAHLQFIFIFSRPLLDHYTLTAPFLLATSLTAAIYAHHASLVGGNHSSPCGGKPKTSTGIFSWLLAISRRAYFIYSYKNKSSLNISRWSLQYISPNLRT